MENKFSSKNLDCLCREVENQRDKGFFFELAGVRSDLCETPDAALANWKNKWKEETNGRKDNH